MSRKKQTIAISIHVDGYYGLVKGVPRILKLLKKYKIKTTFFINMGKEANIFQLLKYRRNHKNSQKNLKVEKRYTKIEQASMILLNRKLGQNYKKLLIEIEKQGHEVEPHCWSHLLWSKNFEKLNHKKEIFLMKRAYENIFNKSPKGFAPPTWKYNQKVIELLKEANFQYIAVSDTAKTIKKKDGFFIIPVSFSKNIEELISGGHKKEKIIKIYKKELNKKYVTYIFILILRE